VSGRTDIPTVNSSGQDMIIYFYSDNAGNEDGLDLTVTLLKEIELADNASNSTVISDNEGKLCAVTLAGRTLYKDCDWNTLCLPFAMTAEQIAASPLAGADIRGLSTTATVKDSQGNDHVTGFDATTGALYLNFTAKDEVTAIEAGMPYIVKWENTEATEIVNPVFNGVTVEKDLNDVTFTGGSFKGTYAKLEYTKENKSILFIGEGNTLYWPKPSGDDIPTIGAFRAYFELTGEHEARQFVLNFGEEQTGISEAAPLNDKGQMINDNWYSLDGRRLDGVGAGPVPARLRKGLYIHNGRKVLVRE
jgi:hypothetical protein